jgi:hypothetical protein
MVLCFLPISTAPPGGNTNSRADMMNAVGAAGFALIFYSGWRKS